MSPPVTGTTSLSQELEHEIKRLLAAGEHIAAANALRHHGQPKRAALLYEQVFEHGTALCCFEAAGDVVSAVRVAIRLDDNAALDRLVGDAIARGLGDVLIGSLQRAGRHREVGRVYQARGEHLLAARAFDDAAAWSDAAFCYEELGNAREAGLLLERWLDMHPDDDKAALRLGRILARFGRHDDAISLLQRAVNKAGAVDRDAVLCRAAPTMALAFAALGYIEAARSTLSRWTKAHSRLGKDAANDSEVPPSSLDALLSSARAAAFAAIQQTSQPAANSLTSRPPVSTPPSSSSFDDLFAEGGPELPSQEAAADLGRDEQRLLLNGRYLLGEPLGGGGVGQVFRAHDAFADRPVAVKIFGAQVLASEAVQAWAKEARAAAALQHPALVKLVELNMAQGFVVSELHGAPIKEGGDGAVLLEDKLNRGGEGGWLLPMVQQVLDALSAAHRTGLVHGGLKPQNVFLLPGGVKLLDTGAHRLLALRSTETGGLASVWPYLSPQMLFGQAADVDGDLYALAAIVYRALTGRPPFSAATADRSTAPLPPSSLNPEIPTAWNNFVVTALHPDPAQRFASADEMLQALPGPLTMSLPRAQTLGGLALQTEVKAVSVGRYVKGALFGKSEGVKTYQAQDAVVGRPVWLLEALDPNSKALLPFVAASRLWRGVQPVYDVLVNDADALTSEELQVRQVIIAREVGDVVASFEALRAVPQGMTRDLTALAEALAALHQAGFAAGGFDLARALGPVGPRLRLCPAPLLVAANAQTMQQDWQSFEAVVDAAFNVVQDPTLDARGRLLAALHDGRFLERSDLEQLAAAATEPWPRFLLKVTERLVVGAQSRVVARLVRSVLKG